MRKYQFQKWPFLVVLFTGLTCLPFLQEGNVKAGGVITSRAVKQQHNRPVKDLTKKKNATRHRNETYLIGPQLLLLNP